MRNQNRWARETLTRIGALPLLARLEAARLAPAGGSGPAAKDPSEVVGESVEVAVER